MSLTCCWSSSNTPQRILTREQLLDLARGHRHEAFDRSIDVQVSRLRRKLEPDTKRPEMIRTVRNGGYLFTPQRDAAMSWLKRIRARDWPQDTVARWIALTIILAMLISLALNGLFIQLAGVWARPPLTEIGLLEKKAAAIARLIEAAPAPLRNPLAQAANENGFTVTWHPDRHDLNLPKVDDPKSDIGSTILQPMLRAPDRRIEAYEPADWTEHTEDAHYALLIELSDSSWLMFSASSRSWGLDEAPRYLIVILLVLISTALVALIATRRLATPLQRFAEGARRFGVDFRAPPIEPLGPPRNPPGHSRVQRHAGSVTALHPRPYANARRHLPRPARSSDADALTWRIHRRQRATATAVS